MLSVAAAVVALVVLVDVIAFKGGCDDCSTGSLLGKVLGGWLVVGAGLLVFILVGTKLLGFGVRERIRGLAAVAAIAGGLLAAPVPIDWEDGCRSHEATAMLIDAPRIALSKPDDDSGAYEHTITLRNC